LTKLQPTIPGQLSLASLRGR